MRTVRCKTTEALDEVGASLGHLATSVCDAASGGVKQTSRVICDGFSWIVNRACKYGGGDVDDTEKVREDSRFLANHGYIGQGCTCHKLSSTVRQGELQKAHIKDNFKAMNPQYEKTSNWAKNFIESNLTAAFRLLPGESLKQELVGAFPDDTENWLGHLIFFFAEAHDIWTVDTSYENYTKQEVRSHIAGFNNELAEKFYKYGIDGPFLANNDILGDDFKTFGIELDAVQRHVLSHQLQKYKRVQSLCRVVTIAVFVTLAAYTYEKPWSFWGSSPLPSEDVRTRIMTQMGSTCKQKVHEENMDKNAIEKGDKEAFSLPHFNNNNNNDLNNDDDDHTSTTALVPLTSDKASK